MSKILLELFAGTRSMGKEAEKIGYELYSVENDPQHLCNMTMSILDFEGLPEGKIPDVIWASPPCTSYSIAAISHHRHPGGAPKTEGAMLGDMLVKKTLEIISYYKKLNPNLIYFIENPRGYLRKMDFMQDLPIRHTVTYCQYGDSRMKPTDIWTNSTNWKPKPMCHNGDKCHESAPRGSRTGTQGIKGAKNRSIIPEELCKEVIKSTQIIAF